MAGGKSADSTGAAASSAGSSPAAPSELVQRLRRGELSVDEFLDLKVEQAIHPFEQLLPPDQLAFTRELLRQQLETDPLLLEYVRTLKDA